jgi:hypothetical protein
MVKEIEMTKEEQTIMYMKCSKKELCEMLIDANWHLKNLPIHVVGDMLCGSFDADLSTSSATKCKCGREKWGHPEPRN